MIRRTALCALALFALSSPASAQIPEIPTVVPQLPPVTGPVPDAYQANDGLGFRSILPSGTRGRYNAVELAAHLATGATVPHCCDQLPMYSDLVYATPG